jgi:hypothetical protein
VVNNTIYDSRMGIWCSGIGRVRITGNVIYGMDADGGPWPSEYTNACQGIFVSGIDDDVWIAHNTIYDSDGGIELSATAGAYSGTALYWLSYVVSYGGQYYTCIEDYVAPGTVTADAGTDVLTFSVDHGRSVNDWIAFTTDTTLPAPLATTGGYYVKTVPTSATMTISTSLGGATLNITDAGTGTHSWRGLKGVDPSDTDHWQPMEAQIVGNVIANRPISQYDIKLTGYGSAASSIYMDYNLAYHGTSEIYEIEGSTDRTLAYVIANTSYQDNGLNSDPLFTDAGGLDFMPTLSSPAVGAATAGSGETAYEDFDSTHSGFGGIQFDRAGNARPQGGTWDMGAYEYASE